MFLPKVSSSPFNSEVAFHSCKSQWQGIDFSPTFSTFLISQVLDRSIRIVASSIESITLEIDPLQPFPLQERSRKRYMQNLFVLLRHWET